MYGTPAVPNSPGKPTTPGVPGTPGIYDSQFDNENVEDDVSGPILLIPSMEITFDESYSKLANKEGIIKAVRDDIGIKTKL